MNWSDYWTDKTEIRGSFNLLRIWNWIKGRKRRKLRQWLADNRKRRRQALHYKPVTEVELYDPEAPHNQE